MKSKTIFFCTECGNEFPKWMGQCPACKSWNTLTEQKIQSVQHVAAAVSTPLRSTVKRLSTIEETMEIRFGTGIGEFDRVLGGGLVEGSVVLLSGEPGIGKSTLLMQISDTLAKGRRVLYVSGEESRAQLKLRAERLGVGGAQLYLLNETTVDGILSECERLSPDVIIVDSIQTVYSDRLSSAPGSVTQVRESAMALIGYAKSSGAAVFLVGHVNKEGGISGPKILEHMVDAVLYFEGERQQAYRIIRAIKNRYGSVSEIGVFEMTDKGLLEVENPSEMLLAGRPKNISGNCAVCTIEGTRPIIAEIQALVTPTAFPAPRRTTNGIDYNRMCLIIAVLEKRLGLKFYQNDVYLNVIGGMRLDEPATDVALAMALISSMTDRIIPDDLIAIGELGLAGECRSVSNLEQRIKEAERLGFKHAIVPYRNIEKRKIETESINIIPIRGIYEVLNMMKENN